MWISSYRALLQLWVQLCWVHLALYPVIVGSSSCLKRSVGTSQMRCLAKILSLIPTTAVQSALQSAVVPSLHRVRQGSQSVLQRVPQQHCLCQGWSASFWLLVWRSQEMQPQLSPWRSCAGPQAGRDSLLRWAWGCFVTSRSWAADPHHRYSEQVWEGNLLSWFKQYCLLGVAEEQWVLSLNNLF